MKRAVLIAIVLVFSYQTIYASGLVEYRDLLIGITVEQTKLDIQQLLEDEGVILPEDSIDPVSRRYQYGQFGYRHEAFTVFWSVWGSYGEVTTKNENTNFTFENKSYELDNIRTTYKKLGATIGFVMFGLTTEYGLTEYEVKVKNADKSLFSNVQPSWTAGAYLSSWADYYRSMVVLLEVKRELLNPYDAGSIIAAARLNILF
ncbi:MAG: hypothetical protein COB67_10375 [SAR324 cluster bacterium]|uniref:Uncharacterized protein n=1 Tax=SAR324 cluster bacterium TaxID=2024889 RepID=A0A2A4SXM1_9DELT|nr:MAG: hypothetical protein COB67_10375 [SAR324 cluster bacterium]